MKFSEQLVWEAVGKILPGLLKAKNDGLSMSLPRCLESAACECWLRYEQEDFKTSCNKVLAGHVVKVALMELNQVGWMVFGKVSTYFVGEES